MKKTIIFLLLLTMTLGLSTYFLLDRFSIKNITYEGLLEELYSPPPLSELESKELDAILKQPYSYLGKGHQSYAFLSENQQYVLKFFKFTYLKPSWIPLGKKQEKTRQMKLRRMFIGYRIAYEKNRDNTGILFVHLSKTSDLKTKMTVKDKFGFPHTVDLDNVFFVVQRKAKITRDVLQGLLNRGDLEGFKKRFGQLLDLYISEYKRGLVDGDHNIMSNTGFLPDKAIRIDVGRLTRKPEMQAPEIYMKDLRKVISKRIDRWLKINYPKNYNELHQDIEAKLATYAKQQ